MRMSTWHVVMPFDCKKTCTVCPVVLMRASANVNDVESISGTQQTGADDHTALKTKVNNTEISCEISMRVIPW